MNALLTLILVILGALLVTASWMVSDPAGRVLALAGIACSAIGAVRAARAIHEGRGAR